MFISCCFQTVSTLLFQSGGHAHLHLFSVPSVTAAASSHQPGPLSPSSDEHCCAVSHVCSFLCLIPVRVYHVSFLSLFIMKSFFLQCLIFVSVRYLVQLRYFNTVFCYIFICFALMLVQFERDFGQNCVCVSPHQVSFWCWPDSRWPPQLISLSAHKYGFNTVSFTDVELQVGMVVVQSHPHTDLQRDLCLKQPKALRERHSFNQRLFIYFYTTK